MHALQPTSILASGDKSGVVDSKSHWLHFKAMLHVFVGPGNPGKDLAFECNRFPSTSHTSFAPIGSSQDVLQAIPVDQQARSTTKCQQFQMDDHVGTNEQCSNPPNGISNGDLLRRGTQTREDQYSHWHTCFPIFESGETNPSNLLESRSSSPSSHLLLPSDISHSSPDSQFTAEDVPSRNGSDSTLELLHPVPRQSPYTVTSYFASDKFPETAPVGTVGSQVDERMCESSSHLMRGSGWTNTDLAYPCSLQDAKCSSATSAPGVTDAYASKTVDSTYSNPLMPSWTSLKPQMPWDVQRHNASQDEEGVGWNPTRFQGNLAQQNDQLNQFSAASDDANGLPWIGNMPPTYIQPSSLLDPFSTTCPSSRYSTDSSNTFVEDGNLQCFDDSLTFQSGPRPNEMAGPLLESHGYSPYQSCDADRIVPWTSDARNALLIEYKHRGLSYKDIKRIGGFKEAESTLRGRFRTLTKSKEQRVRKPQWQENDVSFWSWLLDTAGHC
ncbi:hypothetical protein BJY00DRAFT_283106 [Aspergillus carlsbadensis]|nr:hypothetical protein BJY00DRAFT_283106 [Aspergillus carlsbadensis]